MRPARPFLQYVKQALSLVPTQHAEPAAVSPQAAKAQQFLLQRQQRLQQQQQQLGPTAQRKPGYGAGQRFAANLFKGSLLVVTLPMAGYILVHDVLVHHLLRGLQSDNPTILKITLHRAKSYLFCNYLVECFGDADGLITFTELLSEQGKLPADAFLPYLECLEHLMRFEAAKSSLLMLGMIERLEHALLQGWFPADARPLAKTVYLDLHAARRIAVETEFGRRAAGQLAAPLASD